MSFAGHALDAIKRVQYNRSLLLMRRAKYNELKKAVSKIQGKHHTFHDRKQLSESELIIYKKRIKSKIKRNRQKAFFISGLFTIVIIGTIYLISVFLMNYFLRS